MSTHVPLAVAARISGVKPGTIRRWVFDRHVIRYSDGYDVYELLQWVDARDPTKLLDRAGIRHADRPGVCAP